MVDNIAADMGLMASKVRWLLPKKYFDFAASSAAGLLCLYIIGVLNTQRFSALVLDIGDFCDKKAYIAYGSSCIIITSTIVYFFNKSFEC